MWLGLALGLACAKAGKDEAPAKPPTKRERCEALARDATRTAGLAVGIMVTSLSDEEMSETDRQQMRGAMRSAEAELVERCLGWDEDVFECFGLFSAGTERCEKILELAMGGTIAPEHVPEGPAPSWTFELPADVVELGVVDGQVIAALEDSRVVGVAAGKSAWERRELDVRALAMPPDGSGEPIVALTYGEVVGLGPDGVIRFRTELPAIRDPEAEELGYDWVDEQTAMIIARQGSQWIVGDDDARLLTLSPSGELAVRWQLPDETFESDARLYPLEDGSVLLQEDERLRWLDAEGHARMDVRALDDLTAVDLSPDHTLILRIDDDLVTLDLDACRSSQPITPSGFPQPGRFVYVDEDLACGDCVAPPPGCVKDRVFLESWSSDLVGAHPGSPTVVESMDGVLGMRAGKRVWAHAMSADSPAIAVGDHVLFVGSAAADEPEPLRLWSLGFDGEVRGASPLSGPAADEDLYWSEAGRFVVQGRTAAVVLRRSLSLFEGL